MKLSQTVSCLQLQSRVNPVDLLAFMDKLVIKVTTIKKKNPQTPKNYALKKGWVVSTQLWVKYGQTQPLG